MRIQCSQKKFSYVDKWLSNDQINYKLSNHFWEAMGMADTRITQTLKLQYIQYMRTIGKTYFRHSLSPTPSAPYGPTMVETYDPMSYTHVKPTHKRLHNITPKQSLIDKTIQANIFNWFFILIKQQLTT